MEPGTTFVSLGIRAVMTMVPAPMANAPASIDPRLPKYAVHFPIKSGGTCWIPNPKRSLICAEKMITAMPVVKPTMRVWGKYFSRTPKRRKPMSMRRTPAMNVATVSPSMPYFWTMP